MVAFIDIIRVGHIYGVGEGTRNPCPPHPLRIMGYYVTIKNVYVDKVYN